MGTVGCVPVTEFLTTFFNDEQAKPRLRELGAMGALPFEYLDLMASFATPNMGALVREEFGVLPKNALATLAGAWALADTSDKAFEVVSVRPAAPMDFARHRRVRLTVDVEDDAVRVGFSHIATRHASWYAPEPATVR
jgi:hypothetical protein